jgi:hypothetical protein
MSTNNLLLRYFFIRVFIGIGDDAEGRFIGESDITGNCAAFPRPE